LVKSDVGTYAYPAAGLPKSHAVSSIAGTVNGVTNPTFAYDANGNMTSGAGRTITYTAFDMAATIVQGAATLTFDYDTEHNRTKQTTPDGTIIYISDPVSGLKVEKVVGLSITTWNDYLFADSRIVGARFARSDGPIYFRYFVEDHLSRSR
jgi:YD repeat-containing protein